MARWDDESKTDSTSLRGLTGRGPTQVSVSAAMRARDVSRPRPAHLTEAAALDLEIASGRRRTFRGRRPPRRPAESAPDLTD